MGLAELPQQKCTQKNSSPKYESPKCPECGSQQIWKDGIRYNSGGKIQRYLCRECGYRFSEPNVKVNVTAQTSKLLHPSANLTEQMISGGKTTIKEGLDSSFLFRSKNVRPQGSNPQDITTAGKDLNAFLHYNSDYRVCASKTKAAKNLVKVETRTEKRAAGATKPSDAEIKGKLVEYLWFLKKRGYTKSTVKTKVQTLRRLVRMGVNLLDPESVKQVIAMYDEWSANYKKIIIYAYDNFAEMLGISWKPPICKSSGKLPFIPLEKEVDALIAGCSKKVATSLQLMKETGIG